MMRGYSPACQCLHCKGIRRDAEVDAKPAYGRSIRVAEAALCCNCDSIVDRLDVCPECGSRSLITLANVLNRSVA